MHIKKVFARSIKDSRKEETIEVTIHGQTASAPSGKSTGKYETPIYHTSLSWNIKSLNSLSIPFHINSFNDLSKLEHYIQKTFKLPSAKHFGANALLALELTTLKALAKEQKKPIWQFLNPKAKKIPMPIGNAIGGGLHSHSSNHPTFQEFLLIPKQKTFKEQYKTLITIHTNLKNKLKATKMNDEGAWETKKNEEEILDLLSRYKDQVNLGVDVAASSFYKKDQYSYGQKTLDTQNQITFINALIEKYNLLYVEDPLQEEDFKGFSHITKKHLVVGDDLTATQPERLQRAIQEKAINAMIIKPNQNGSLIETKHIVDLCKKHRITTILSHRSGETTDNWLADLAVAFNTDYIKCGIATKWRTAKLDRLAEIETQLRKNTL
ncbi:MAG TPA: enolase C-terminal domain-like protein [Candidatus Nanoarchaeia archaeon]|nr:enolase C-terminal domain-like protein [Candidatus Nanoarchaeia archaeon]